MKQLALILSLLLFSLPMRPDIAESGCLMKAVEAEELPCLNIPRAGHSLMVAGGEPVVVEEVPDGMFYSCIALEKVNFNPNTRRIGKEAFYYCEALQTITLPDGVELIDEDAFKRCTALECIGLPAQLKTIGGYAFQNCDAFTQFTIPASVDSIGNGIKKTLK